MSTQDIYLTVILVIAAVVLGAGAFRVNPITLWVQLINYFRHGPDSDDNLSKMDRQQRIIDTVFWLIVLIPLIGGALFLFFYM